MQYFAGFRIPDYAPGDASDIMMAHPLALQLRNLQSLVELGVDTNTTVVFRAPMMTTVAELGAPRRSRHRLAPSHAVRKRVLPGQVRLGGFGAKSLEFAVKEATDGRPDHITLRVMRGHPTQVLVTAAEEAELLVVGSRGHGGFAGLLLGSVSEHAIAHAKCPVLVTRHLQT